ncbi:MAG: bifunctional DNA-formamidopyrimidine glycosylase/DNA-(apurinic or apyrimidinic site) lyase [Hyphomicrobiales bacterium]|nr:bifunctional DNA-formamidopyrimidine glycosylase/DNA-(apurinic or apyrimidinic site) lyase [Hyphomicrobiales bacterium]
MPELPEVETVRRGLEPVLAGAAFAEVVQRRKALRFPLPENFAQRLTGRRVERLERRAKYLLATLDNGEVLAMHLGMSGRFTIQRPGANAQRPGEFLHEAGGSSAHDHVEFIMSNGVVVRYNDVRRFGFMALLPGDELATHKLFCALGPEPLGPAFTPQYLAQTLSNKRTSLKAALLDQRIVAGLGNIYVCEALHRARLSPRRQAGSLTTKSGRPGARASRLVPAIKGVLEDAILAGGSTLRDYRAIDGALGYFQHSFAVYARLGQRCPRDGCKGIVSKIVQGGRSTFFCPQCQR